MFQNYSFDFSVSEKGCLCAHHCCAASGRTSLRPDRKAGEAAAELLRQLTLILNVRNETPSGKREVCHSRFSGSDVYVIVRSSCLL
jgi:hypothetical protein